MPAQGEGPAEGPWEGERGVPGVATGSRQREVAAVTGPASVLSARAPAPVVGSLG